MRSSTRTSASLPIDRQSGRPRRLPLLACLVLAAQPAAAAIITFDDFTHFGSMPIAGDRYQDQGVLLETTGLQLEVAGPVGSPASYYLRVPDGLGTITVRFVLPGTSDPGVTDSVSFHVIDFGSLLPQWAVSVFDLSDNLLDQQSGASNDPMPVSFTRAAPDIHRLVISHPSNGGIDTLSFGALIPEPATAALLTLGLLCTTVCRRRPAT
jgi:hypothetical protein